jgi:hypothetical protein
VYEGEAVLPPPHAVHSVETKNLPAGLTFLAVRLRCTSGDRSREGRTHRGPAAPSGCDLGDRGRMQGPLSGAPINSMPATSKAECLDRALGTNSRRSIV